MQNFARDDQIFSNSRAESGASDASESTFKVEMNTTTKQTHQLEKNEVWIGNGKE
jgi:hypothetical protein